MKEGIYTVIKWPFKSEAIQGNTMYDYGLNIIKINTEDFNEAYKVSTSAMTKSDVLNDIDDLVRRWDKWIEAQILIFNKEIIIDFIEYFWQFDESYSI